MGNEQTSIDEQKEIMEKFPDSKEQIFNFYTEENNESNKEFKRKKDHHKTLSMKIDAESRQKLLNKKNFSIRIKKKKVLLEVHII